MNTQLKRLGTFSAAIFAVSLMSISSPVFAQRDAGAKARGDMSPFWSPKYQTRSYSHGAVETRRSFSYQPVERSAAQPPVVERRSFSYEPSYPSYCAPKKAPWQYPKADPRRYSRSGR